MHIPIEPSLLVHKTREVVQVGVKLAVSGDLASHMFFLFP